MIKSIDEEQYQKAKISLGTKHYKNISELKLDKLMIIESLSVRTYNVCSDNGLNSIEDIVAYYYENHTFKKLRNCGTKSDSELKIICDKYSDRLNVLPSLKDESAGLIEKVNRVRENDLKWEYLQDESELLYEVLSVRSKNSINTLLNSNSFDLDVFTEKAILVHCNFGSIRSAGEKTIKELNTFKTDIIKLMVELDSQEYHKIDLVISELSRHLGIDLDGEKELREILKNKELNIVQFFDQYVLNSADIADRDKEILIHLLNKGKHNNDQASFEKIGEKLGITRERVRQLVAKHNKGLNKRFQFIKQLFNYSYDLTSSLKCQTWKITPQPLRNDYSYKWINNTQNTLANILKYFSNNDYYILSPSTKLKGKYGPYDQEKYKRYRNIRVCYSLRKDFLDETALLTIVEHIYELITGRISEDKVYLFEDFNLSFEQTEAVLTIVTQNFELQQKDGGILLTRNTIITAPELIEMILLEYDELMTAEQIHEEYNNRFPSESKPMGSIRGALNNERFIYFRGSGASRYGLKAWEEERDLKSGSIKNMCLEFIAKYEHPVHIHELGEYVLRYRDTTIKNILSNLKADPKNQFKFYKGSFIGITCKDYSEDLIVSFKNPSPKDANQICSFVKNHLYYDLRKMISKFSQDFDLKPIQVKHIIATKSSEGILRVKEDRVYYNMMEEDSIIGLIFKDSASIKIAGFNPYKVDFDELRLLSRVLIISDHKFTPDSELFEFSKYDVDHTDVRSLIVYHKSLKSYLTFIWKSEGAEETILGNQFFLTDESDFVSDQVSDEMMIFRFSMDRVNTFGLAVQNAFGANTGVDVEYDLSIYNINGMTKLDAYSHIANKTEQNKGVSIDLLEAKRIYNLLQIKESC